MHLKTYLSEMTREDRLAFAAKCESNLGHLQNVMYGIRSCATDLAILIERHSGNAVRVWDLKPDDWHKHWPMLIGTEGAPTVPAEQAV